MRRLAKIVLVGIAVVAVMFFFFAPVVWTSLVPCLIGGGHGYASLSYHFFNVGEVYLGGQFKWWTQSLANCF